jgi:S-formylglutathione hydrolase FrmB
MIVLLPERRHVPRRREDKKYPVLYALHGHGQDHTNWQRDGYLEHLLKEEDVIVVMPHGGRSFYTNAKYGHEYFSFLTEELPIIIANYFPISTKREDTFIAGISMGGYGAMKAALLRPDLYSAVASLSGGLNPYSIVKNTPHAMFSCRDLHQNIDNIFGGPDAFYASENYLPNAFDKLKASDKPIPKIYMCCGKQDFVYEENIKFCNHVLESGTDLVFEEGDGQHTWDFWNNMMPRALKFLGFLKSPTTSASSLG